MHNKIQLVIFRVDQQRFALSLSAVERIVRAVEITPLPDAPSLVLGIINMAGHVLPVLNLRRRFALPEREVIAADQFLIATMAERQIALAVDEVQEVIECPDEKYISSAEVVHGSGHIQGIVKLDDGLVLIQDLEKCLSFDEARALDGAMSKSAVHGA